MGSILMVIPYGIFAGCSFTWGQGLWSYYPTKWHVPTCDEYTKENAPIPPDADIFRIENRYPHLLGNMVSISNCIIKRHNGGTDDESLRFIDEVKGNQVGTNTLLTQNVPWSEVKICVFQTTQSYRSPFKFEYKNEKYQIRAHPGFGGFSLCEKLVQGHPGQTLYLELDNYEPFLNWLVDNNYTPDDFFEIHTKNLITRIENKFRELQKDGIECFLISWTDDYLHHIKSNEYLTEKFVPMRYNGSTYDTIDFLLENFDLSIKKDKTKLHECGGDGHPSLECHKIIAKSLLPHIRKRFDNG